MKKFFNPSILVLILAVAFVVTASVQAQVSGTTTNSTTTNATSTDTDNGTTTPVGTVPNISSIASLTSSDGTGVLVSWNTDVNADSQVAYGTTTNYSATSTLNPISQMSHVVQITGLIPGTLYHYEVMSRDSAGLSLSADQMFTTDSPPSTSTSTSQGTTTGSGTGTGNGTTTTATSTTSTGTTTPPSGVDMSTLQAELSQLQTQLNQFQGQLNGFWAQLQELLNSQNQGGVTSAGSATLSPSAVTLSPGATIDWNGRNFGHEEDVQITQNGNVIMIVHADGGGNFTTGSFNVPSQAGTYSYTFHGMNNNENLTSTITVL